MSTLMQAVRSSLLLSPEVNRLTSVRRFNCLFSQGQHAEAMFIIEEGLVKQTRTNQGGDRIILAMCGPGDIVGEEALGGAASTYAADAEVLTPATLYKIPRETLSRMVHKDVEFAGLLIDFLLKRRQTLAEKVELLEIRWPSGAVDMLKDLKANQVIFVKEGAGIVRTMQFDAAKSGKS